MNPITTAMRRPLTVRVAVGAILLGETLAVTRMAIDIVPNLNLPVFYVCQPYGGLDAAQMEGLLTDYHESHFLYISGIHHVESKNVQGVAIMKLVFHSGTNMSQAMAEPIGCVTRARAFTPPGTVSPFNTRFDAGSVPVGYLVLSSETKSIGEIQDQALAVGFAMIASCILSSTFVPVLAAWIVKRRPGGRHVVGGNGASGRRGLFDHGRDRHACPLTGIVARRRWVTLGCLSLCLVVIGGVGSQLVLEIFPRVDAGRFQLRLKARTGTQIEKTEAIVRQVLQEIEAGAGPNSIVISVGYVGLIPSSYPINAIYQWSGGLEEGILRVALNQNALVDVETLKRRLRQRLPRRGVALRFGSPN